MRGNGPRKGLQRFSRASFLYSKQSEQPTGACRYTLGTCTMQATPIPCRVAQPNRSPAESFTAWFESHQDGGASMGDLKTKDASSDTRPKRHAVY